jgi:Arc/MetJ-type ribon-helix-helix transcriptional regulator
MMGTGTTVKVTYSLPEHLVEQVRSVVREGAAPSYSAFVERALCNAVRQAKDRLLAAEFEEAAGNPLFLADVDEVERDFAGADAESAGLIR